MSQVNKRPSTDDDLLEAVQHGTWEVENRECAAIGKVSRMYVPDELLFIHPSVLVANVLLAPSSHLRRL